MFLAKFLLLSQLNDFWVIFFLYLSLSTRPLRSFSKNQNFKSWMSRVYIPFSYNKVFHLNLLFVVYFWNFFCHSHFSSVHVLQSFVCYVLWMRDFLIISTLIFVISHCELCLLIVLDMGPKFTCLRFLILNALVFVSSLTLLSFPSPKWKQTQEDPKL